MLLIAKFSHYFFGFSIFVTSLFLVMLVLVQRGRGGGLTGALGGAGGQSAFGTKAGDLFTRITVGVAAVWIFLCAAAVFFLKDRALPDTGVDLRNSASMNSTVDPAASAAPAVNAAADSSTAPAIMPATNMPATNNSLPATGTGPVGAPAPGKQSQETPGIELKETAAPAADDSTTPADLTP